MYGACPGMPGFHPRPEGDARPERRNGRCAGPPERLHRVLSRRVLSGRAYRLPRDLSRHVRDATFAPERLRAACREAGEGLGREDAREARFRSAAGMVALWEGLDLPAHIAPYALRDARLGYLAGYTGALVSGGLPEDRAEDAAKARWGEGWREKLSAARRREG